MGFTRHAAIQAYDALAQDGLVEKRGRSGAYVPPEEPARERIGSDTARWLSGVLADDFAALNPIDRSQPVLLTFAAHQKLGPAGFRLLAPSSPAFCPSFEQTLAPVVV